MEILVSVAAKVAEYMVSPIKRSACYTIDSQTYIEELRRENDCLKSKHNKVNRECQEAIRHRGEEIEEEVTKWLQGAQATLTDVESWIQSTEDESMTCKFCSRTWGCSYKKNKEAYRKKVLVDGFLRNGNFSRLTRPVQPPGIELYQHDELTPFESVCETICKIMEALQKKEMNMIGVCGMGGIGKTTLVKEVGFQAKKKGLFNMVVFVVVSQSPDISKIQAMLSDQLGITYSRETELGRAGQLKGRMKSEEKILVILDDVWSKIDLREIGIPHGVNHSGCKILITTRRDQVCSSTLMNCQHTIHLNLLEENEAWNLFQQNVGKNLDQCLDLGDVPRQVFEECGKLPLALIVVGRAMRDKKLEEWKLAVEKLQKSRLGEIEWIEDDIYERIKLSYDFLKAESTKKCFLLCSLFPEDHEINIAELAILASFYDEGDVDSLNSARRQVKRTIVDLIESNLLMTDNPWSETVKMHDLVRDAALWITSRGEDMFLVPIQSQRKWLNEKVNNVAAISLLSRPNDRQILDQTAFPRLKILLMAPLTTLHLKDDCFQGMLTLRILDLTAHAKHPHELVLPSSLQHLKKLRILLLRRWKLQGDISVIGSLSHLELQEWSSVKFGNIGKKIKQLEADLQGLGDADRRRLKLVLFKNKKKSCGGNVPDQSMSSLGMLILNGSMLEQV